MEQRSGGFFTRLSELYSLAHDVVTRVAEVEHRLLGMSTVVSEVDNVPAPDDKKLAVGNAGPLPAVDQHYIALSTLTNRLRATMRALDVIDDTLHGPSEERFSGRPEPLEELAHRAKGR